MFHPVRITLLLATVLFAGCASVSTGIVPAGPANNYSVTERQSPLNGGARTASQIAMDEAWQYCATQGRGFAPVQTSYVGHAVQSAITGPTGVALTFKCTSPNDPDDTVVNAVSPRRPNPE